MLASAFTFTIMTTLIKYLGDDYSPALQTFYRQLAASVALLPWIIRYPVESFRTSRPGILAFRAVVGTFATILAFYAYQEMPLAEANALSFTRALWIVPLAILILHENIGPWRLGATLVGFAGVVLMLQPSVGGATGLPALAALSSALLFATTITGMKVMSRDNTVLSLTVWSALLGLALATPWAVLEWRWPNLTDLTLLSAMGVISLINQVCYIKGMSIGDAAAMAPIDYMRLVFALAVGFLLFHEIPNAVTMAGAGIVICATLFITLREAYIKAPPPPPVDQ